MDRSSGKSARWLSKVLDQTDGNGERNGGTKTTVDLEMDEAMTVARDSVRDPLRSCYDLDDAGLEGA